MPRSIVAVFASLALVLALPVLAGASHLTLKQWSAKYGHHLTAIVQVVEVLVGSSTTAGVAPCIQLKDVVHASKSAPAPPALSKQWDAMLKDLTTVASTCIASTGKTANDSAANAGGEALGRILVAMANAHIALGSRLEKELDTTTTTTTTTSTLTTTAPPAATAAAPSRGTPVGAWH